MTESDWLGCTSVDRLLGLTPLPLSDRRWRLLACGICRQFERCEGDEVLQAALAAAEAFADEGVSAKKLATAQRQGHRLALGLTRSALDVMNVWQGTHDQTTRRELAEQATEAGRRATAARLIAASAEEPLEEFFQGFAHNGPEGPMLNRFRELLVEARTVLVHDVLGNPFRPARIDPLWLTWRDGFIAGLARCIYEQRRFDEMVILGDALEDAGCADRTILDHCHGPGPHVRGCWVLDRLLGYTRPPRPVDAEPLLTTWPEKYSTPLDPVIGTGIAEGGWVSVRIESAILTEAVHFVSEVDPEDLPAADRPLLPRWLTAIKQGLRQGLAQFAPRGRPLAGTRVTVMRLVCGAAKNEASLQTAACGALERAVQEAVMVPLETRSRGAVPVTRQR